MTTCWCRPLTHYLSVALAPLRGNSPKRDYASAGSRFRLPHPMVMWRLLLLTAQIENERYRCQLDLLSIWC